MRRRSQRERRGVRPAGGVEVRVLIQTGEGTAVDTGAVEVGRVDGGSGGSEGRVLGLRRRGGGGGGASAVIRAQLLSFNLKFGGRRRRRDGGGSSALGRPGVRVDEGSGGVAVAAVRAVHAAGREVLVELVHVEPVDGAELGDVHVAEVDVLAARRRRSGVELGFRGRGGRRGSMRMTWKPEEAPITVSSPKHEGQRSKVKYNMHFRRWRHRTCPLCVAVMGHLPPGFCLIQDLLLLGPWGSAVPPRPGFGGLASPRLVLVVRVVSLVLHPQPVGLLDEGTLLCLGEKSPQLPQRLAELRVVQVGVLVRQLPARRLRPHHERVHRPLHARLALQRALPVRGHRQQRPVVALQHLRHRVADARGEALGLRAALRFGRARRRGRGLRGTRRALQGPGAAAARGAAGRMLREGRRALLCHSSAGKRVASPGNSPSA